MSFDTEYRVVNLIFRNGKVDYKTCYNGNQYQSSTTFGQGLGSKGQPRGKICKDVCITLIVVLFTIKVASKLSSPCTIHLKIWFLMFLEILISILDKRKHEILQFSIKRPLFIVFIVCHTWTKIFLSSCHRIHSSFLMIGTRTL